MRRSGLLVVLLLTVMTAAACGSGKSISTPETTAPSSGTTQTTSDVCKTTTLQATEKGVSPSTITVTVTADVGSSLRPGLFQGSVDAVQGWAKYMNANGGLACRQVAVKVADSKLSSDDAKNAITTACGDSLALVGTTALFLDDMKPAENCKDKAGATTGLPDLAVLQTLAVQQCSKISFAMLPGGGSCPYSGEGLRTFNVSTTPFDYYLKQFPAKDALHGVWLIPADLASTISASMPGFRASQQLGIKLDQEFGASAGNVQSDYTPYVQAIKSHKATYARSGLDYLSTVYLRKEAQVQGVDTVKVWDCSLQCYDKRLISSAGAAMEGQYAWLSFLPFEDQGSNPELDNFLQYDTKPDGFGAQAWVAGEVLAKAVNDIVAKSGPNGITRAALLAGIRGIHDYDAGGFIAPTDIGGQKGSLCLIGMQVKDGKFVRVDPVAKGEFDCSGKVHTLTIDPVKEYKG